MFLKFLRSEQRSLKDLSVKKGKKLDIVTPMQASVTNENLSSLLQFLVRGYRQAFPVQDLFDQCWKRSPNSVAWLQADLQAKLLSLVSILVVNSTFSIHSNYR
jgi:hypothetical protein